MSQTQVEHLFRHEYGPLVASLLRRVGTDKLDIIEDAVQYAMMQALHFWSKDGLPKQPSAWLYQVAFRYLLTEFRKAKRQRHLLEENAILFDDDSTSAVNIPLSGEMNDALLDALFATCDEALPIDSQLVFTLKILCGFSTREIALRLFISEANVYKRFSRAKSYLKDKGLLDQALDNATIKQRLPLVQYALYLLFTEGYFSSHADKTIRKDLCEEAIHLTSNLSESKLGNTPETNALLALMYFHLARINSRQQDSGELMLLEQQDRKQWHKSHIAKALNYLAYSAQGTTLSRYHLEASIAAEHCIALSFRETRWDKIVSCYELLERVAPSPLHYLNHAIAIAEWQGAESGLAVLNAANIPTWLERSYHWDVVQADLGFRSGECERAKASAKRAIQKAPSASVKQLLLKRFSTKWNVQLQE